MKIAGKRIIAAPYPVVESILADGRKLVTAVPQLQRLSPLTDDQRRGRVTVLTGPLQGEYEGTFAFTRPETGVWTLSFEGHGAKGIFQGNGRVQLEAQDEQTIIHYEGDIVVSGQLAAVSPRLLQANVNAIIRRTLEGIDRLLWPEKFAVESSLPYAGRGDRLQSSLIGVILAVMGGLSLVYFLRRQSQRGNRS